MSNEPCCCHGYHPKTFSSTGCSFTVVQQMDGIHLLFIHLVTTKVPQSYLQEPEIIYVGVMLKFHGIQVIFVQNLLSLDFKGEHS